MNGSQPQGRAAAFHELKALERASPGGHIEKPYLERLPVAYEPQLSAMQWVESLIVTAGVERTIDALTYYRSIGWITGEVQRTLSEHARSIADSTPNGSVKLTMEDHRESLMVIAQLAQSQQRGTHPRDRRRR